jgi:hypothetical protein
MSTTQINFKNNFLNNSKTKLLAALGFTPENVLNKKTSLDEDSDIFYPTQAAVKTYVDDQNLLKQNELTYDPVLGAFILQETDYES